MNKMNKFETTRILTARALELQHGAKAKVEVEKEKVLLEKDYVEIAQKELDANLLDLEIYHKK